MPTPAAPDEGMPPIELYFNRLFRGVPRMLRNVRFWLLLAGLVVVFLISVGVWLYWAARQAPAWYEQAVVTADPVAQKKASGQMEQRAADLISGLESTGHWEVLFTEAQINGWLSHGLKKKHPELLPEGFSKPRVKIESDGVTGACQVEYGAVSGVVSLKVDVYLTEANVVAARIRRARLGRVPWPLDKIMDGISQAARRSEVPLVWRETEGDPVAVIRIPLIEGDKQVRIETLKLEEGKLYVAGVTERVE
jgi:hypothetical protein